MRQESNLPSAAAEDYVRALIRKDYTKAAGRILNSELAQFQAQLLTAATSVSLSTWERKMAPFFMEVSIKALAAMSPAAFFAYFMSCTDVARGEDSDATEPEIGPVQITNVDLFDGGATIETLTSVGFLDGTTEIPSRVGLRLEEGQWRVLLDERVASMAQRIRETLEG